MLISVEDQIGPNGDIEINANIINKLKFDYEEFKILRGDRLNDNEFLVLVLYCLFNELIHLNNIYYDNAIKR